MLQRVRLLCSHGDQAALRGPADGLLLHGVSGSALLLAIFVFAASTGCRQGAESTSGTNRPEASFAEQAKQVRAGRADAIRLDVTSVSDTDLEQLAGLAANLRRINLSHSEISNAGLAKICQMRGLEQLRLASPRITDAGLEPLDQLQQLHHLHLINAPLTDASVEYLSRLKSLKSLYLDGARLSDDAIQRLIAALPEVHLHLDGDHHRLDLQPEEHKH